jgi:hypothetical protein
LYRRKREVFAMAPQPLRLNFSHSDALAVDWGLSTLADLLK